VVGIRLPDAERAAFIDRYQTTIFCADSDWPPAKEYVAVPDDLLARRSWRRISRSASTTRSS
jgi:hypothetical protein